MFGVIEHGVKTVFLCPAFDPMMQKMADFCGFLVFFMVKTVFLCPTFDPMMQKNGGFLRGCGIFLVASVGCHFAKALLVQAIYTRCCGCDEQCVVGAGYGVSGKIIACLT